MFNAAILFLIIGIIGVALGFGGVGSIALNIGWGLLGLAVILFVVHLVAGRDV